MNWKRVIYSQKTRKEVMRGTSPGTPKPVPTSPKGRICAEPGCGTKLSIYNPEEFCAIHEK